MVDFIEYNPSRDVSPVEQNGFVDLCDAIISNQIPSDLTAPEESFNEMPIDSMIGRPSDCFDAMEYNDSVSKYQSAVTSAKTAEPSQSSQDNAE